ncbi:MAG: DUF2252 family protein, partial [Proteobacteria bacterium]|nr:DUF2252 family protein [Pseudomonadota bacterium]
MRIWLVIVLLGGCANPARDARDAFVLGTLADDNAMWARREPELVRQKLVKMQRDPYTWLRGTAAVYWRDATTPGDRLTTAFGDPASSRVLLVGDPHPENIGSFRAPDGELAIEFNDFDAAGYGPYTLDVRRLAAGMIVATAGDAAIAREVARGYAAEIAALARGESARPLGRGVEPILAFLEGWPATAEAVGEHALPALMELVNAIQKSP